MYNVKDEIRTARSHLTEIYSYLPNSDKQPGHPVVNAFSKLLTSSINLNIKRNRGNSVKLNITYSPTNLRTQSFSFCLK